MFPLSGSFSAALLLSLSACQAINWMSPAKFPGAPPQSSTPDQVTLTTIAHFNGDNGSDPVGLV